MVIERSGEISDLRTVVTKPFARNLGTTGGSQPPPLLDFNSLPLSIGAERVVVIDPNSNIVLFSTSPTVRNPVASIQKLLTALLVTEKGGLDDAVEVRPEDLPQDTRCLPLTVGLRPSDVYPRRSLLAAMLIGSANDAASALARDHSGTVKSFVKAMNARAKELGMRDSVFRNPQAFRTRTSFQRRATSPSSPKR